MTNEFSEHLLDPTTERDFLREFRAAGIDWAAYAAGAGSILFASFLAIAWLLESHTTTALVVRFILSAYLAFIAFCCWTRWHVNEENYVLVAGSASALALGGTLALLVLRGEQGHAVAVQTSPAIIFGLFLHYAFLRLPMRVSATIGWVVGFFAVLFAPSVVGGSETLRDAVYLAFSNVFGMIIGRLVEDRERKLFVQRRMAEAARAEARKRQLASEETTREKNRLIAAISHDLRQPMTAAMAYLAVAHHQLRQRNLDEADAQLGLARQSVTTLGTTLDHLVTTARYESGAQAVELEWVDLHKLMESTFVAAATDAAQRGIDLRLRMPDAQVLLRTDPGSIRQVLGNLVANAVKFTACRTEGGGKVLVAARLRGERCRIDVIDTGIGIAQADEQEIWKPYVQLGHEERDRERGLGLGLFLVRAALNRLPEHDVRMASNVGRGSRFTVTLPAMRLATDRPDRRGVREPEVVVPTGGLRGAGVLLLEDDRDARQAIAGLLAQWEMDVVAAPTTRELLAEATGRPRRWDAIVCDYRLSARALGTDAIAAIRARLGYAPAALLITGDADVDLLRSRAGPATTVLAKPVSPHVLTRHLLAAVATGGQREPDPQQRLQETR